VYYFFIFIILGKTKNVRELEEQNLALSDQLTMAQAEISTLHSQLAAVRTQKHQAEQEWIRALILSNYLSFYWKE
jgi:FtsZ-binding cell division protein ZapB